MLKNYNKIVALDFELYNTKYYWSICWAGVCVADTDFNVLSEYDIIINPDVKERFVGNEMTFPFKWKDLSVKKTFEFFADKIFGVIDEKTLVVGHAILNDLRMIVDVSSKYNIKVPEFDFLDSNIIYNAAKNAQGEHSLTNLASEFGIEFLAHNPAEDARATLFVIRDCIKGESGTGNLKNFLDENSGIHIGKFYKSLARRCYGSAQMGVNQLTKIKNNNKIFDTVMYAAKRDTQSIINTDDGENKIKYFFDNQITSENNISAIVKTLLDKGYGIAGSSFSADIVVTNNLSLKNESKYISFKKFLRDNDYDLTPYDFTPLKIRDANGKKLTLKEYYDLKYQDFKKDGFLSGKSVSFSLDAEKNLLYDDCLEYIFENGGSIEPRVENSDIFIVNNNDDIDNKTFDGRIKAYRRSRKAVVTEFTEFYKK